MITSLYNMDRQIAAWGKGTETPAPKKVQGPPRFFLVALPGKGKVTHRGRVIEGQLRTKCQPSKIQPTLVEVDGENAICYRCNETWR